MRYVFLIVDDERLSREYVSDLVLEFMPGSEVHTASSVSMALPLLEKVKPDVLFLDIRMPDKDGFNLLGGAGSRDFELVFITAYSQYALPALKQGASDYILKPVKKSEFRQTLDKIIDRRKTELERRQLLLQVQGHDGQAASKLVISHQAGATAINLGDIVYLKADNTYTTLYTVSGEKVVTSKPISHFEKTLDPLQFFRIHKSYIINLGHFKEYSARNSRIVTMSNGATLLVSRYRLGEFLQRIKTLPSQKPAQ